MKPKRILRTLIILAILISNIGCDQRDVLMDNQWIFLGGTLKNQPIDFRSTDPVIMLNKNGQNNTWFNFNKYEDVILPGINSRSISARWKAEGDKINFSIDRMQPAFGSPDIYQAGDSIQEAARSKKFDEAMLIYGQEFEYSISLDTLRLFSKDVKLWAVRDNSLDGLKQHLKPKGRRR